MACNTKTTKTRVRLYGDEYFTKTEDCSLRRYTDKENNSPERQLVSLWWDELIQKYGIKVCYYVNKYDIKTDDRLYGEQRHKEFHDPKIMTLAVNYSSVALSMGKWGFVDDSELTAYITFEKFEEAFVGDNIHETLSQSIEPKAGDVFKLYEFGNDRPHNREGKYFEVTSRTDDDITAINQLGGHYVWLIKAKKFDWSFERGLDPSFQHMVANDNENFGRLSADNPLEDILNITDNNPFPFNTDDVSTEKIVNLSATPQSDVYGGY